MDTKPTLPVLNNSHPFASSCVFAVIIPTSGDYKDYINNITPTNSGVTSTTGANGPRALFDSVNDYLDYGASNVFMPTTNMTVIIGCKKSDGTDRDAQAICVDDTGTARFWFTPNHWVNGFVYCDFGGASAPPNRIVDGAPGTAGDDVWAAVMGSTIKQLWKNGSKTAEIAAGTTYTPSTATFRINKAVNLQGGDLWELDFVLIFDTEFNSTDIATLFADPVAMFRPQDPATLTSASINAAGTQLTTVWSEAVDPGTFTGTISGTRKTISIGSYVSGTGTTTLVYGLSPSGKVFNTDFEGDITLSLDAGATETTAGAVASDAVVDAAVTNNSTLIYTPTGVRLYYRIADGPDFSNIASGIIGDSGGSGGTEGSGRTGFGTRYRDRYLSR